jgi:hypothetical protein
MSLVHWTAFDDGEWACGGTPPAPLSLRPFRVGPDAPRVATDPRQVTCDDCKRYFPQAKSQEPRAESQ